MNAGQEKQEKIMTLMERAGSALWWAVALMRLEYAHDGRYRVVFPMPLIGAAVVLESEGMTR